MKNIIDKGTEMTILKNIQPFLNKNVDDLMYILDITDKKKSKAINSLIVQKMFKVSFGSEYKKDFEKLGVKAKTIRVEEDGKVIESMSFPTFKFKEIIKQLWEESDLLNLLESTRFLFIVLEYDSIKNQYYISNAFFWNMPIEDIEECRKVWTKTVKIIKEGVKLYSTDNMVINNLPKASDNRIMHVRPHAKNRDDTYPLPDGTQLTKQCFWLNNFYVMEIIRKEKENVLSDQIINKIIG